MEPKLYYWCVYNNVKADILKYLSLSYNEYTHTCITPFADPEIPPCFCFIPLGIFVCFVLPLLSFCVCVCAVLAGIACCWNAKSKKAGTNVFYIFICYAYIDTDYIVQRFAPASCDRTEKRLKLRYYSKPSYYSNMFEV